MKLEIVKGSVVFADVDVIVNAANEHLQAGGGVCGAIFQEAGLRELQAECNAIGYCRTGHAVITNGHNLKVKNIIHAVGPTNGNSVKLRSAFYNSLVLAESNKLKTIGMVPISSGIFGFPIEECAEIAISVILNFKAKNLETCYMYCYNDYEYQVFVNELNKYNEIKVWLMIWYL